MTSPLSARIEDMTWCIPGERMDEIERVLRYAAWHKDSSYMAAASIIACYRELVLCNRAKREHIVRNLKRIMKEREAAEREGGS